MRSPFTGKVMKRVYEKSTWNFRGEQYEYEHIAWLCEDTGEQFTDDASDMASFVQVTNQYREKYGIPYTDEIVALRNRYGLSAAKMAMILGIGINQYRLYEQGEVPSVSNGRLIRSIMNPKVMQVMVESSRGELTGNEYEKVMEKIKSVIAKGDNYKIEQHEIGRVFCKTRGRDNGYAQLSLDRLKNTMLYVLEYCGDVWCTKMNKLLFYIDFMAYRERGFAITGLSYRAIDFGPVPERWDKVYSEFQEIRQDFQKIGEYDGVILKAKGKADTSLFTEEELGIIGVVCERFGKMSSRKISGLSHEEVAWTEYHVNHELIPFDTAFQLRAI